MLKLSGIVKKFEEKTVLDGIDIEIEKGEIYGLVGANGAGKTTLMNIISQQLQASAGTVEIDGKVIKKISDVTGLVGYMLDIPAMFEYLTAYEYFEFLSATRKISKEELKQKSEDLLKQVGLLHAGDKRIKNYSRGMKQRLGIAAALLTDPKVILMDEPSSALDPKGRTEVIEIIKKLALEGKTIMLSTHILADVERVCTEVGLLSGGKIVTTGTLREVLERFQENIYEVEYAAEEDKKIIEEDAKTSKVFEKIEFSNGNILIYFKNGGRREMFKTLAKSKADIKGIYLKPSTIEDIFLKAEKSREA